MKSVKHFLSTKDAAEMAGMSPGTLANLRCVRKGPEYFKRGRKVLYDAETFERWLRENPVKTIDSIG